METSNTSVTSSNTQSYFNWTGTHVQFYQAKEMREWILLDNESTASIFCNKNYLLDIKEGKEKLVLWTNGGKLVTKMTAIVPGYPKRVWYHPEAITNIFAFHKMEEFYCITYNTNQKKAFIVYWDNDVVEFKKSSNGLYFYQPKETFKTSKIDKNQELSMLNTISENKEFFTPQQISRAQ